MILITPSLYLSMMESHGYEIETSVNVVGWRINNKKFSNTFDDIISLFWKKDSTWRHVDYPATTLPGIPWVFKPFNPKGVAILVPGQYEKAYTVGSYKGYRALLQVAPVRVYRDNNRDTQIDKNPANIEEGLFGINIHKAGFFSRFINKNSAGCQVFQKATDFEYFMSRCYLASLNNGNRFTYTLLEL